MFYISTSLFHRLLSFTSNKGIKTDRLLKKASVNKSILANKDEKIPLEAYYAIMDAAIEMTGDNFFGLHLGERAGPGDISTLGYIITCCRTIREALEKIGKYFAIIASTQKHIFIIENDNARLMWETTKYFPNICIKHCIDSGLVNTYNMLRNLACEPVEIKEVWFKIGTPDDMSEYNRIFKCPVLFNQPSPALVFPAKALDVPLKHPNPTLLSLLERHANSFLSKINEDDLFSKKISLRYLELIQGKRPTIEEISKDLGMSKRTIQKKLNAESKTFRELADNVHQELSKSYLVEKRYMINDITYLVGFSSPSSFLRAFKRWTNMTPRQYQSIF
jgi:AraC-like DNA-binding protein